MKIGVFDSGSGGLTTLGAVKKLLPEADYYYIADIEHHPYGDKTEEELNKITRGVVRKLADWGAEVIVIACNTATTRCIRILRKEFPGVLFVGTEPAVKLAAGHGCQNIVLLATPSTVTSQQVKHLVTKNISQQTTALVPCGGLADLIERNVADITEMKLRSGQKLPSIEITNSAEILEKLQDLTQEISERGLVDGVILGCTHYVLIKNLVTEVFPNAEIFDGNSGVARRVRDLYASDGSLH